MTFTRKCCPVPSESCTILHSLLYKVELIQYSLPVLTQYFPSSVLQELQALRTESVSSGNGLAWVCPVKTRSPHLPAGQCPMAMVKRTLTRIRNPGNCVKGSLLA